MGWMDIMSKRNKSELNESRLIKDGRAELKQLRDKHLNGNCIDLDLHELREDSINRLKVVKSNSKRRADAVVKLEGWK